MFLGHYSVAFAARTERNKIPLWVLFVAVQLLDLLWAPFAFLGLEKVRIVFGVTATSDLIVHRPDLAIYDDTLKVGFGLLNYKGAEFAMEIALLVIGIALYLKRNVIKSAWRKIGIVVFGVVLIQLQTQTTFGGRPLSSNRIVAITTLFAAIAFVLEKQRRTHF